MRYRITDRINNTPDVTFDTRTGSKAGLLASLGVSDHNPDTGDFVAAGDLFDALMLEPADPDANPDVKGAADWLFVDVRPAWTRTV